MSQAPAQEIAEQNTATHQDVGTAQPADAQVSASHAAPGISSPSRWKALQQRIMKLPRSARIGGITLLLIAALAGVYLYSAPDAARLQIICQYGFRSAQITVMVDGSSVYTGALNASQKKRLGFIPKGSLGTESFSRVIDVAPGKHVVQVHVTAPAEGYDQARSVAADLVADRESILTISAVRRNALAVNVDGASAAAATASPTPESHPLPKSGLTIIFSILGTMVSASISFLVQEFWRSHKNRLS